jgi:hypothetical protein
LKKVPVNQKFRSSLKCKQELSKSEGFRGITTDLRHISPETIAVLLADTDVLVKKATDKTIPRMAYDGELEECGVIEHFNSPSLNTGFVWRVLVVVFDIPFCGGERSKEQSSFRIARV